MQGDRRRDAVKKKFKFLYITKVIWKSLYKYGLEQTNKRVHIPGINGKNKRLENEILYKGGGVSSGLIEYMYLYIALR